MAAAGAAEPMDSLEVTLLAAGGAVILVAIIFVMVLPSLGGAPTDATDSGHGGPSDGGD